MSMIDVTCRGVTKSGAPCQGKAGPTGYCPMHDPVRLAEREKAKREQEVALQASQAKFKPLQEILTVMKATCERKGWKASIQHFDQEAGQYATLGVDRYFYPRGKHDPQKATAIIEVTYHKNKGTRSVLHSASSCRYGIEDLMDAINVDLEQSIPWLGRRVEKGVQAAQNDAVQKLEHLLRRFHRIAYQLTLRHDNRQTLTIRDEYDVQDLLHAQLLALFEDVRPEDPAPTHAGKASRLDFFLKREKIMVEVKMTRDGLRDAQAGEQLIIDIERYRARSDCNTLVCFIYDPDRYLKNPQSLEDDLSRKHDHLTVKVIVYSP